jgi:hypothetical protein
VSVSQVEGPLTFHVLEEPLQQVLAETVTPPVPNEKLHWPTFVRVLVYYFVVGVKSGRLLLTHLRHAPPELGLPARLKKATFFEAFRRFSPGNARELFSKLRSRLSFFPVPEMADLGQLCAVDGSHWPALFRMRWAVVGSNKPTALLHLAFGLNRMIPVAMLLTESNSSERQALKQMIEAGVTYVADRGYFAYYLLLDIAAASAFFVIRAPCSVTYEVLEHLPVKLPTGVPWLLNVKDQKVHCDKGEDGQDSGTWRVVRFVIGESEFILFTNRWDLTTWQIIIIYAYRWQIELLFLFIKRTLNGLHLLTHDKDGLQIQFYLMLTAALLLLHFKQRNEQAVGKEPGKAVGKEPGKVGMERTLPPAEKPADPDASGQKTPGCEPVAQVPAEPQVPLSQSQLQTWELVAQVPAEPEPQARQTDSERSQTQLEPATGLAIDPEPTAAIPIEVKPQTKSAETQATQPPVGQPQRSRERENPTKPTGGPPACRQGTVEPGENSKWYHDLGKQMATFWRIGTHWLEVLRMNLARVWNPDVFQILPGDSSFRKKRGQPDCLPQRQAGRLPELTSGLPASLAGNLAYI